MLPVNRAIKSRETTSPDSYGLKKNIHAVRVGMKKFLLVEILMSFLKSNMVAGFVLPVKQIQLNIVSITIPVYSVFSDNIDCLKVQAEPGGAH